jgi:hypothetical protein
MVFRLRCWRSLMALSVYFIVGCAPAGRPTPAGIGSTQPSLSPESQLLERLSKIGCVFSSRNLSSGRHEPTRVFVCHALADEAYSEVDRQYQSEAARSVAKLHLELQHRNEQRRLLREYLVLRKKNLADTDRSEQNALEAMERGLEKVSAELRQDEKDVQKKVAERTAPIFSEIQAYELAEETLRAVQKRLKEKSVHFDPFTFSKSSHLFEVHGMDLSSAEQHQHAMEAEKGLRQLLDSIKLNAAGYSYRQFIPKEQFNITSQSELTDIAAFVEKLNTLDGKKLVDTHTAALLRYTQALSEMENFRFVREFDFSYSSFLVAYQFLHEKGLIPVTIPSAPFLMSDWMRLSAVREEELHDIYSEIAHLLDSANKMVTAENIPQFLQFGEIIHKEGLQNLITFFSKVVKHSDHSNNLAELQKAFARASQIEKWKSYAESEMKMMQRGREPKEPETLTSAFFLLASRWAESPFAQKLEWTSDEIALLYSEFESMHPSTKKNVRGAPTVEQGKLALAMVGLKLYQNENEIFLRILYDEDFLKAHTQHLESAMDLDDRIRLEEAIERENSTI